MNQNVPSRDFPLHESVEDAFGNLRSFIITCDDLPLGYVVRATEEGKDGLGYEFSSFSETSPYNALWALRQTMYRALATRHITKQDNRYRMMHDSIQGRITWSQEKGLVLVVDGISLDMDDLAGILETHEGWQFRLQISDAYEDFSR